MVCVCVHGLDPLVRSARQVDVLKAAQPRLVSFPRVAHAPSTHQSPPDASPLVASEPGAGAAGPSDCSGQTCARADQSLISGTPPGSDLTLLLVQLREKLSYRHHR